MSPTSYRTAPPRINVPILPQGAAVVKCRSALRFAPGAADIPRDQARQETAEHHEADCRCRVQDAAKARFSVAYLNVPTRPCLPPPPPPPRPPSGGLAPPAKAVAHLCHRDNGDAGALH